ncbi:hypothetical protein F2P56_036972 [Juglans regia]|uniref:Retrovirus-related Pol polyprotein from transposon TNT 1-94-like beta-barrel domain-containing protein n=1 Tax=Juglans regia TaxID=51240 RepID=A0A833TUJ6_JUGRE|nr:hypothetical protein F2P56_036972 [Juglans regia]
MTRDDIIMYVLVGLGHEYDSFVASISARTNSVTLEEIYSLFLTTEARLSRHQLTLQFSNPMQMLLNVNHNLFRGMDAVSLEAGGVAIVMAIILPTEAMNNPRLFARFDISYQDSPKTPPKQAMVAMTNANNGNWELEWHVDTGATHHLTNDVANLNLSNANYNGLDSVHVGNGKGLQIFKTGSSKFSTATSTFVLNQVLLVPEIQKNLISVQLVCIDNNVYFEFHAHFFLVKDY